MSVPNALEAMDAIAERMAGCKVAVFLDYDGTLAAIAPRPELAVMSETMRAAVARLARLCPVAVVSGRGRENVENLVRLDQLTYAGAHGFDIAGPGGELVEHGAGKGLEPVVAAAEAELRRDLEGIEGALVEGKRFAVAVHYRLVAEQDLAWLEAAVDRAVAAHPELRRAGGKKVFELRPRMPWDKGKAVIYLLEAMGLAGDDVLPFYLGDDETDRDAFRALQGRGLSIYVGEEKEADGADYWVADPAQVERFLGALAERLST